MVVILRGTVVHDKIKDADDINRLQTVVPFSPFALFADGKRGIIQAAVFEELLFAALHLHQDFFASLRLAIHIEHRPAVCLPRAEMFRIEIGQILDFLTPAEQAIDETDEQFLVHLRPE